MHRLGLCLRMKTASNTLSSRNLRARHKTVKHESSYTERHWLLDKRFFLMADPFVVVSPSVRSSSSWLSNSLSSSLLSPSSSSSASIPSSAPNKTETLHLAFTHVFIRIHLHLTVPHSITFTCFHAFISLTFCSSSHRQNTFTSFLLISFVFSPTLVFFSHLTLYTSHYPLTYK